MECPPDAMPQPTIIPLDTYGMFLSCTMVSALECGAKLSQSSEAILPRLTPESELNFSF
jgi:hypothetical protein